MNDAPSPAGRAETLYDRLWRTHVVCRDESGRELIYIDRQILHEVSTPQSFALLRENGLRVRRPETQLAVPDHAVPTAGRPGPIANPQARAQVALLEENCRAFGIEHIALDDPRQGIVHVVSPEQGFTLPGITLICGDSHTATHGAFGALAFGVGASECGTAMATQCLWQRKARTMRVAFSGLPGEHVSTKDLALALIARIGAAGATGHAIEYTGEAVRRASMEARMSLCNMSIEAGSRTGLVAPDETTFGYLAGRPRAPAGAAWDAAVASWRRLRSDEAAVFDREVELDAARLAPQVSYGTSPDQVVGVDEPIPEPAGPGRAKIERALAYMGLRPGMTVAGLPVDHVFIGSCTNGRIEDLRAAAAAIRGRKVAEGVRAIVVPGSGLVKAQAEAEGLDRQFLDAGFEWRSPGCSLCVAMNGDIVPPGGRAISTSNRNFEGRQGPGARTHLASPATAAASAVAGRVVDVRKAG